jgi:hypothetical protein
MNRMEKANLLLSYLRENGVHSDILQRLAVQPLPDEIIRNLTTLTLKKTSN